MKTPTLNVLIKSPTSSNNWKPVLPLFASNMLIPSGNVHPPLESPQFNTIPAFNHAQRQKQ